MNTKALVFVGMGFELVGIILGALYLGKEIDEYYQLAGLATAGLSLLVLAGWLYHLVILLKRFQKGLEDHSES